MIPHTKSTSLHIAVFYQQKLTILLLLNYNAKTDIINSDRNIVLENAI